MRSILSISLPAEMVSYVTKKAKKARLSVSGYMKRLIMNDTMLISEEELLKRIREGEENYRKGNVKVLRNKRDIERFFKSLDAA